MQDLKLPIRIALQNLVWEKYKITIPNFEILLAAYLKKSSQQVPQAIDQISSFVKEGFDSYLQPVQGFICSKRYSCEVLDRHGIVLEKLPSNPKEWAALRYKDQKYNLYWMEFTNGRDDGLSASDDTLPSEFVLVGKDNLPHLTWS